MAKRMGAKTIEVKASHQSLISRPDDIAHLILEAAGQRSSISARNGPCHLSDEPSGSRAEPGGEAAAEAALVADA